ncbi:hypothetical protein ACFQZ4_45990 [Catellatospora coxensis]|uniref:hypothetical protein n=1 Tax=Catellatospora coxensis TaxID=310354 RepID=UPI0019450FAC|nr:hypothetical protein [Catellatospora coxensis]
MSTEALGVGLRKDLPGDLLPQRSQPIDPDPVEFCLRFWVSVCGVPPVEVAGRAVLAGLTAYFVVRAYDPAWLACIHVAPRARQSAYHLVDAQIHVRIESDRRHRMMIRRWEWQPIQGSGRRGRSAMGL